MESEVVLLSCLTAIIEQLPEVQDDALSSAMVVAERLISK